MSDHLIDVRMADLADDEFWSSLGLPIPKAPHFIVTGYFAKPSNLPTQEEIATAPAITHRETGRRVSQRLVSIEQAEKIAAALEGLPIPWDGTVDEMKTALGNLPSPLRRWLRVEVCGHRDNEVR